MTIKKGDWIKVPAGTKLEYATPWPYGTPPVTKRDVVVQATAVTRGQEQLLSSLPEPLLSEYKDRQAAITNPYDPKVGYDHAKHEVYMKAVHALDEEFTEKAIAADPLWNLTVFWGSRNDKHCAVRNVELAEAPEEKSKKAPKINKKQQMVKGSKWKLTEDTTLTMPIGNPAVEAGMQAWDKANPRPSSHGVSHNTWYQARDAERKRLEDTLGKHVDHVVHDGKAGGVFTVTDKFTTYNPYDILADCGAIAFITFDGGTQIAARYKQLEPVIEAESIPTVDVYVLRNKTTGEYFKTTEWNEEKTKQAQKERGTSKFAVWHEHAVYDPIFVSEFMKAKHYDGIARAKSSILELTGYYHGLPGAENLPEWMGGTASFDFTEDYELVKFDKLARKEVETIDLWDWYQNAWRLRELTVKFGSSVRGCYKELEKKDLLDEQSGMLVFTAGQDAQDHAYRYGDRSALTAEDKEEVNSAIASALKKGKYKRGEDSKSIAVSFPDKGTAMMFKLSYNGNLKVTVIDLADMREVVEEAA